MIRGRMVSNDDKPARRRPVRSFVRRAGRVTTGQRRALQQLWPRYGLELPAGGLLNLDRVFGRRVSRVLEIGFGNGETLVEMATERPDCDFIGIEVHEPGIGHCLLNIEAAGLSNVRLMRRDAVEVLEYGLPADSVDQVHLFFPDPWPKKRHHKRRIVQPAFVSLIGKVLKPGGLFHVATDWPPYAEHVDRIMREAPGFERCDAVSERPVTRFERRGRRLGHPIADLRYRRQATSRA